MENNSNNIQRMKSIIVLIIIIFILPLPLLFINIDKDKTENSEEEQLLPTNTFITYKNNPEKFNNTNNQIETINKQFTTFKGEQVGSSIKSLLSRLISHSYTYEDDETKIPSVEITLDDVTTLVIFDKDAGKTEYIKELNKLRSKTRLKSTYNVDFEYNLETNLINKIIIFPIESDTQILDTPVENTLSNTTEFIIIPQEETVENTITTFEESFNNQLLIYQGKQTGSTIKALLARLIANANANNNDYLKRPSVVLSTDNIEFLEIISDSNTDYLDYIKEINSYRPSFEIKSYYQVDFEYDSETQIINKVIITYCEDVN